MNTYLFCTLLFVLSMKSIYAFSMYPDNRQTSKGVHDYIPSDELNFFGSAKEDVSDKEAKDALDKAKIEPILNQNFTYMVVFISKVNSIVLCQGALIDPLWALTSASCLQKYSMSLSSVAAITGLHSSNITAKDIKNVNFYPDYQIMTNINDLALVEFDSPVILNVYTTPIAMTKERNPITARCDFSAIFNYTLIAFKVDLVSENECMRNEIPKQTLYYYCAGVNGKQIVLTQDDMLGVPLVCGNILYGIKSLTTVFTSVPEVYDWVTKLMKHEPYKTSIGSDVPRYTSVMKSSEPNSQSEPQHSEPQYSEPQNLEPNRGTVLSPQYSNSYSIYTTENPSDENTENASFIYKI